MMRSGGACCPTFTLVEIALMSPAIRNSANPRRVPIAGTLACLLVASPLVLAQTANAPAASPTATTPQPGALTGKFADNFRWESADGKNAIGVKGLVHFDYRQFSPSAAGASTFDLRRVRMGFFGKAYSTISFEVTGDLAAPNTAGVSATLVDAWVNLGEGRNVQLRAGQFKMPFSMELMTSINNIDFLERTAAITAAGFVPGRERGLMVHGTPLNGFTYAVAVSNGAGTNLNDTVAAADSKDVIARLTLNPAETAGRKNLVTHFGVGYAKGSQPAGGGEFGAVRSVGRGISFFTPSAFTTPFDRERMGAELAFAAGPVKLQSEWIKVSAKSASVDRGTTSTYANLLWVITGESLASTYRNGAFGALKPTADHNVSAGGGGAWVLGARYDKIQAHDFAVGTFGGTTGADSITAGVTGYLTPLARVMLNYVQTDLDTPVLTNGAMISREKAFVARLQINW
jgi:phosphate-selective porin OprO and OprP